MIRNWAFAAGLAFIAASPATAGVYSDALGKCLVDKTSDADKTAFMRWMFAAFSASAIVRDLSTVTEAQRTDLDIQAGKLFERLLVSDCHAETVEALKYEGQSAMISAFGVLGQVGGRGLMNDPAASIEADKLAKAMDPGKLAALGAEAGLTPNAAAGAAK